MIEAFVGGVSAFTMGAALLGAVQATPGAERPSLEGPFPLVELRQYTLHGGKRDELIELFERELVESQEAVGMKVIGTFTDLDRPDHFVWLRGFKDMDSRLAGLSAFYGGPVWKAHRNKANATMIDSDNVLLLRAPAGEAKFVTPLTRPALGEQAPAGLTVATIYYLKMPPAEALSTFERKVKPTLEKAGIRPLAWFVPESAPNNFPGLPVREGEKLLIWFADFADPADHAARKSAIDAAAAPLASSLAREPEVLRLKPTPRSLIRGMAAPVASSDGVHDFDFLHGRWTVRHRLLKGRGVGSTEWVEYGGLPTPGRCWAGCAMSRSTGSRVAVLAWRSAALILQPKGGRSIG